MLSVDSSAVAWVIVAVIAAILELSLPTFGAIFVSLGALVAALTAAAGAGLTFQLVIFSFTLGLSLVVLRPRVMAKMSGRGVPSRTDVLIGREGVVTHDIDTRIGAGR